MHKTEFPVEKIDIDDKHGFVYEFLCRHNICVLATADENNQPEAAVIEFSELKTLELIFDTYSYFRKYKNLVLNSRVAFVIGWDTNQTLQYEGRAVELADDDLVICRNVHLQKFPGATTYEEYSGMKYFKVVPTWIRYTDLSTIPWQRFELQFPGI